MARTLKLTLTYDGTRFVGWQRQAEGVSIQGLLEDVLARLEGAPVTVHGAGRTDAGVHAIGQVASVRLSAAHPVEVVARALNACLPKDVRVTDVREVAADFHARFSARSKTYRYLIRNASVVSPFERAFVWHVPEPLDLGVMQTAARAIVGTHDFAAFRSAGGDMTHAIRTITRSEIVIRPGGDGASDGGAATALPLDGPAGDPDRGDPDRPTLVAYEVSGSGFLRHMVRALAGTLVEIGRGQRPVASMGALVSGGSRAQAGVTAPPQGLFLVRVVYD